MLAEAVHGSAPDIAGKVGNNLTRALLLILICKFVIFASLSMLKFSLLTTKIKLI